MCICHCFNPRSRKGNDVQKILQALRSHVSIHVPARGTTVFEYPKLTAKKAFQSTFPQGERLDINRIQNTNYKFQSTFPQGERRNLESENGIYKCFNPRSRKGNDIEPGRICIVPHVSIHVPARGTTQCLVLTFCNLRKFQSTFPQGERHFTTCLPSPQRGVSIHVPARGTTQ